jgi:hypothetical protein
MSYRAMPLECQCGEAPEQILEVGFTSDRHMVIHYWCSSCKRVMYLTRTLEECREFCPLSEPLNTEAAKDALFLQSVGIRVSE